jgi:hypothetical protein
MPQATAFPIIRSFPIALPEGDRARIEQDIENHMLAADALIQLLDLADGDSDFEPGAVVICETTGEPWRKRYYAERFRDIARAAGLPDSLWSMDMRAGGATETDSLPGITDRDLQAAGGWSDAAVANRYSRDPQRRAQNIVRLRQKQATNETDERLTNTTEKTKASGS